MSEDRDELTRKVFVDVHSFNFATRLGTAFLLALAIAGTGQEIVEAINRNTEAVRENGRDQERQAYGVREAIQSLKPETPQPGR